MLTRGSLAAALAVVLALLTTATANASDPISCTPPSVYNRISGTCTIVVTDPGEQAAPTKPPAQGGGQAAGGKPKACLDANGDAVACRDGDAWWSNAWGCYARPMKPQPAKSDPRWAGHEDGSIYECYDPLVDWPRATVVSSSKLFRESAAKLSTT